MDHLEVVAGKVIFKNNQGQPVVEVPLWESVVRHFTLSAVGIDYKEVPYSKIKKGQTIFLGIAGDIQTGDVVYASLNLR